MSSRPSVTALLLAAALGAAGCDPGPAPSMAAIPGLPAGADADAWEQAGRDARTALALGRWDAAAAAYEKRVAMCGAPDSPVDREVVAVELYNLACARSLGGHVVPALDALEQAVSGDFGRVGVDHLLRDPDLGPLHATQRWENLVRRPTGGRGKGEFARDFPPMVGSDPKPFVVNIDFCRLVFVHTGQGKELHERPDRPHVIFPWRPYGWQDDGLAWSTRLDAGEGAAEVVAAAVAKGLESCASDRTRVVLLAGLPGRVRIAWEILLRRPALFTAAVIDGPAPPAWVLLDRGAENLKTRMITTKESGLPDRRVPVKVSLIAGYEAAVAEALR